MRISVIGSHSIACRIGKVCLHITMSIHRCFQEITQKVVWFASWPLYRPVTVLYATNCYRKSIPKLKFCIIRESILELKHLKTISPALIAQFNSYIYEHAYENILCPLQKQKFLHRFTFRNCPCSHVPFHCIVSSMENSFLGTESLSIHQDGTFENEMKWSE